MVWFLSNRLGFMPGVCQTNDMKIILSLLLVSSLSIANEVCSRTAEVRQAIEASLQANCDQITSEDLKQISEILIQKVSHLTLKSGDFNGLTKVDTLTLDENGIETLPEDIFSGLTSLQDIFLSGNRLKVLPLGLFQNLPTVQMIDLSENQISNLPDHVFFGLTSLNFLNLTHNQMIGVSSHVFDSESFQSPGNVYISNGNLLDEVTKKLLFSQLVLRYH